MTTAATYATLVQPRHRRWEMSTRAQAHGVQPGDVVVIEGHHVGEGRRTGEILEVLGEPGHEHYRVRWEEGRETVFYPSSDATIRHHAARIR
jgi:hypothetical protein